MTDIEYTIKRSARARRISIGVHHDGSVSVTIPERASIERAQAFVYSRKDWILAVQAKMRKRFANKVALKSSRTEYKELKAKALEIIKARLAHFNAYYKFSYNRVSIKIQASRWGSCSIKGNLNFNYGLVKLPMHLLDYVVVHELCHLKEMNHGPKFWALVGETIPDYVAKRKELRKFVQID